MDKKKESFSQLRDKLQEKRNVIAYTLLLLTLFAAAAGMALLPDQVTMQYTESGPVPYMAKEPAVIAHLAMGCGFTALFWKWPRELVWLVGAGLAVLVSYFVLFLNVGM